MAENTSKQQPAGIVPEKDWWQSAYADRARDIIHQMYRQADVNMSIPADWTGELGRLIFDNEHGIVATYAVHYTDTGEHLELLLEDMMKKARAGTVIGRDELDDFCGYLHVDIDPPDKPQ
jgi:hypothetical protein